MVRAIPAILALMSLGQALAGYRMVLVSGASYDCKSRFEIDSDGTVKFTLVSGAQMGVPRDQVAWYETFVANGETPPKWAEPMKRDVAPKRRIALPLLDFSLERLKRDLNQWRIKGIHFETLQQTSLLTFLTLILSGLLISLLLSLLLWRMLCVFGEFHPIWKVALWHIVLLLVLSGFLVTTRWSPFEIVSTYSLVFVVTYVFWAGILNKALDVELNNALLVVLFYQVVLAFMSWVLYAFVDFTGAIDIMLGA